MLKFSDLSVKDIVARIMNYASAQRGVKSVSDMHLPIFFVLYCLPVSMCQDLGWMACIVSVMDCASKIANSLIIIMYPFFWSLIKRFIQMLGLMVVNSILQLKYPL